MIVEELVGGCGCFFEIDKDSNQGRQKVEVRPRPKARYKLGSPGKGRYMQSKGDGT